MSSFHLWLMPVDPWYQPPADVAERARRMLTSYIQAQRKDSGTVTAHFEDVVQFHFGQGFKDVSCPVCGAGAMDWWVQALEDWLKRRSEDAQATLDATAGCCGAAVSLHNFDYKEMAGFARFYLQVDEPNGADVLPEQQSLLEEIVGCRLHRVWAHI